MKTSTLRRLTLAEAFFALMAARVALWTFSTKRLLDWASRPPARPNRFAIYESRLVSWAVDRVGQRRWVSANCLPRALAAQMMLRRRGIVSKLCLGVARNQKELAAHAWIELDHELLVGGIDRPKYVRIVEFGGMPS